MTSSALLGALQELANAKQLDRHELLDLLRDGIHAALAKRYGVTVRDEIAIDDMNGKITVTVLKSVVEEVEDPTSQVSLEAKKGQRPSYSSLESAKPSWASSSTATSSAT